MRIGLVLSGGGGKGSYQIGVWKALYELGLTKYIVAISSTSIGTINSILIINNDVNHAIKFWENIRRKNIAPIHNKLIDIISNKSLSKKENLKLCIESNLNIEKLKNTNVELFVMCCKVKKGYPKKQIFKLNDKTKSDIVDIILSTCSVPFIFRSHKISKYPKSYFYDGVIMSRTPTECLDYNSFDKIIVVHLDNINRLHPTKYNKKKYINIYPSIYQGGIYNGIYGFTKKLAAKRINAGYIDTMKKMKEINLMSEVKNET